MSNMVNFKQSKSFIITCSVLKIRSCWNCLCRSIHHLKDFTRMLDTTAPIRVRLQSIAESASKTVDRCHLDLVATLEKPLIVAIAALSSSPSPAEIEKELHYLQCVWSYTVYGMYML